MGSKAQSFRTIHDLVQSLIVNIPERGVEKAWADIARCFNHCGDPRGIAAGCDALCLANVSTEVEHNAA